MKKAMKKLMAALLAVAMVCAMAIPAFAAEGGAPRTGSITINGAIHSQTYKIYRILDLEANENFTAYKYTINSGWDTFVAEHNDVFTVKNGIVTSTVTDATKIQDLANAAGKYAEENNLPTAGTANSTSKTVSNLKLGYYLVVSTPALSVNSLCSLGTTNPNVTINEKNGKPTITKQVEHAAGSPASANDATVGDTVKFYVTINAIDGTPENYVMHDKMDEGLTFNDSSVTVKRGEDTLVKGTDYELNTSPKDGDTFDIKFKENVVKTNDVFTVTYTATLNEKAVVGTTGNKNETNLTYGDNQRVEAAPTQTYTWSFNIFKYFMDGNKEKALEGAQFILYRKANANSESENEYAVMDANGKIKSWTTDESNATVLTSPVSGNLTMSGLANGTYYLKEKEAPQGYNPLENDIKIKITAENWQTPTAPSAKIEYKTRKAEDATFAEAKDGTVKVENKSGTVLPDTGGIGTTIFYVVGGGLMVAAAILLITKKRMENR